MRKSFWLGLLLLGAAGWCGGYDIPPMREVNRIAVRFLPDQVGQTVKFAFDKQDLNGYTGSDAVVFTVEAPSGKSACEVAVPDDGNATSGWKRGPRQRVECQFKAEEAGIYTLRVNTASSVDMVLCFDQARAENAAWAIECSSMRFSAGKLNGTLLLPPRKLGEKRLQIMQFGTVKKTTITNFTVKAGDSVLVNNYNKPPHKSKRLVESFQLQLARLADQEAYQVTSQRFSEVVSWIFPQYGSYQICLDPGSVDKFLKANKFDNRMLELKTPAEYADMAFERGRSYQLAFVPEKAGDFNFTVKLFGKNYKFTQQQKTAEIKVPANDSFSALDAAAVPAGKFQITVMEQKAVSTLLPATGKVLKQAETLVWTAVPGCKSYTVSFKQLPAGKSFTVKSLQNRLDPADFAGKLTSGVWTWQVKSDDGKTSKTAFFAIKNPAKTDLAYIYKLAPAMDTTVKTVPAVACKLQHRSSGEIDLAKSVLRVNGKTLKLAAAGKDGLKSVGKVPTVTGRNTVKLALVDKYGNYVEKEWGFFVGQAPDKIGPGNDAKGNITFFGTPFYPVIYYGYMFPKIGIDKSGFNTVLTNTLPAMPFLNRSLNTNIKVLDSGSVFKGIYSKSKTAEGAEADVKAFASTPAAKHPARLGAWMDEMDVHRSLDYIKKFLGCYGAPDRGWRGVCSCNRSLYDSIAGVGDYLMIDYYSCGEGLFGMNSACEAARKAAGKKPLMVLVMGYSRSDPKLNGFVPDERDIQYAAWAALRLKANAIGLYQCGSSRLECYPENWAYAGSVYRRLNALSFIAYGKDVPETVKVTSRSGQVEFRALEFDGKLYIIAQNCSFDGGLAEFKLNGKYAQTAQVLFEDRQILLKNNQFTDCFTDAATHIYVIDIIK